MLNAVMGLSTEPILGIGGSSDWGSLISLPAEMTFKLGLKVHQLRTAFLLRKNE